jgi:hypothetical protein
MEEDQNEKKLKCGDKVKNRYSRTLTVLVQMENRVYVQENVDCYDQDELELIKDSSD